MAYFWLEDAGYAQVCLAHPDAWRWAHDHLARLAPSRRAAVVLGFQNDGGVEAVRVVPRGLDPSVTYAVSTIDMGPLATVPGDVLARDGVELRGSPNTAARVVLIEPVTGAASLPARAKRP